MLERCFSHQCCLLLPVTVSPRLRSTRHQPKSIVLFLTQSDRGGLKRRNTDTALPLILKHFHVVLNNAPTGFHIEIKFVYFEEQ